jgi:integrase/recombinase XerD
MNAMIVAPRTTDWHRLKSLVLDSVSSPITKRVYSLGLDEFFEWFGKEPRPGFTKATVSAWRVALEARGVGSVSINVRITAVRKLAVEAADNGLLAPELANGITRVKGVASKGVRLGNWLSLRQAQALLNAPDTSTRKGLRDRAMLAILLGCGLRRSEVAALTLGHIQQRDNRWCIVDLVGKHGRVRTIPMPSWVKGTIDTWTSAAAFSEGSVLRRVNRGDKVQGAGLSEKVVWQLLRQYAAAVGAPGIAPHDLRRYAEYRIMPNGLIETAIVSWLAVDHSA